MFIYGLLTGIVIGVVICVALLFVFASARISSRQEAKERPAVKKVGGAQNKNE